MSIDVAAGTGKIAGSAQRRRHNRIMMHGSIFLWPNLLVPKAASASDVAGRRITTEKFSVELIRSIEDRFSVRLDRDDLTREEMDEAESLSQEKYSSNQ